MGNVLIIKPENTTAGEGGQIILQGATGYSDFLLDIYRDYFRIVNATSSYEFRGDGIYLNGVKLV